MLQLSLHRSVLGFITAVLTWVFCTKGCKKRTPSFVAFSDTQVNCLGFLFVVLFFSLFPLCVLMSCLPAVPS